MPIVPCSKADRILVIIGPSGTGKSNLVEKLVKNHVVFLQRSHTTRPHRQNDDDTSHIFVTDPVFARMFERHDFLDTVQPFGLPYQYGMMPLQSCPPLVTVILMRSFVIDLVIKHYPKAVVYQLEVPVEVAEQRLSSRGHELGTRLEQYESELNLGRQYAKRVFVSDGVTSVYEKVLEAIETDFNNTLN